MNKSYHINDDVEEKMFPIWFYSSFGDECGKSRDPTKKICSHHRSHRLSVTCIYCQNNFKTFKDRKLRCSVCCQSIEIKLKTYTSEKLRKLANVYNIKRRRQEYIIDELVKKVEIYIL